jgi:hypothetical protein
MSTARFSSIAASSAPHKRRRNAHFNKDRYTLLYLTFILLYQGINRVESDVSDSASEYLGSSDSDSDSNSVSTSGVVDSNSESTSNDSDSDSDSNSVSTSGVVDSNSESTSNDSDSDAGSVDSTAIDIGLLDAAEAPISDADFGTYF